jgi:murein DD-endopeptidase MepM/ murein hydrolase activator NlpD
MLKRAHRYVPRRFRSLLLGLAALAGAAFAGDIYKWQDEAGNWHYSDRPPPTLEQSFETIEASADPRQMVSARRVGTRERPEHAFLNRYHGPAELELNISEHQNVQSEPPLPARFVLPPAAEQTLVRFQPIDPTRSFSYQLSYRLVPGPPSSDLPGDALFYPPFARGSRFPISQGIDDRHTHLDPPNRYAVDIAMPTGTPVLAARAGVVMDFEDDFHGEGKAEPRFMSRANFVRILHDDDSMAVYAHLQANSTRVRPGMRVEAGHWIANSGNSGYSSGPHLHFVVQLNVGMALESLPFRFRTPTGGSMDPDRPQYLDGVLRAP